MSGNKKTPQDVRDQGEPITYYISERIVNIADLEDTIKNTQIMLNCLSGEIAKCQDLNRCKDEIQIQLDSIRESLAIAVHFEFLLERRRVAIENNHPYEGL